MNHTEKLNVQKSFHDLHNVRRLKRGMGTQEFPKVHHCTKIKNKHGHTHISIFKTMLKSKIDTATQDFIGIMYCALTANFRKISRHLTHIGGLS